MNKYFAGIGSRETPEAVQNRMSELALELKAKGYILRSGGAIGADLAFEHAYPDWDGNKEIFTAKDATKEAIELTSRFHPAWNRCNDHTKALHGRNAMIILGRDLRTPVEFVICWTKDGMDSGGTGQGIRIARAYNIPVRNLYRPGNV